jgi:C-terminal processing protease CtpA/Prc
LGLKFTPGKKGDVEVMGINPGTQATRHAALKPGLILKTVGGTSVLGMPYKQVTDVIKSNPG